MAFLGGVSNESFIKRSLIFSITGMVFMAALLTIFLPDMHDKDMDGELASLTEGYYDFTGSNPTSEEIWALTGIYTPYGTGWDPDREREYESPVHGTTADGWIYGSRIASYSPSQLAGLSSDEKYRVVYNLEKGLYYYTEAGSNLTVDLMTEDSTGTLYTAVTLDKDRRSDVFFTPGGRTQTSDGMYYDFSGWRYVFQPIRDYQASNDLNVSKTSTSLSVVWYDYYGDTGLSGVLMLNANDAGVSYITGEQIVESFQKASYSSKFAMKFNGLELNVYVKINPYAMQFGGYSVEECYNNGFFSIMVTSPSVTSDSSGFTLEAFSPDRAFGIVIDLLTFSMSSYGLTGVAATLCSLFFTVSLYTSLIAIGIEQWPVLIFAGVLAVLQTFSIL